MTVMTIFQLIIICLILAILLSFRYKPEISRFEIERLAADDKKYKNQLRFLEIYPGIRVLVLIIALILASFICALTVITWGFFGSFLALVIIILAFFLGQALNKITKDIIEKNFVWFNKYFAWAEVLGKVNLSPGETKITSKQELMHIIETGDFIEATDKLLLIGALKFIDKKVGDIMVAKGKIVSVKDNDVIGPKLLDELHQSGHLVFPVMKNKNIIGMLHVEDVIALDQGEKIVTEVMRRVPTTIVAEASLEDALNEMRGDHNCQLLVVSDNDKLIGLIDICDIVNVLFGRKTD